MSAYFNNFARFAPNIIHVRQIALVNGNLQNFRPFFIMAPFREKGEMKRRRITNEDNVALCVAVLMRSHFVKPTNEHAGDKREWDKPLNQQIGSTTRSNPQIKLGRTKRIA